MWFISISFASVVLYLTPFLLQGLSLSASPWQRVEDTNKHFAESVEELAQEVLGIFKNITYDIICRIPPSLDLSKFRPSKPCN